MGEGPPPTPSQSHLERLPVELIEQIFLHSVEFNLPRASLYLSRVLSNPLLYTWLIRLAFSSPNESSKSSLFTADFLPYPLNVFALSAAQRQDLQNNILTCRWCTFPLLRKCQNEYLLHVLHLQCRTLDFPAAEDRHVLSLLPTYLDDPSTIPETDQTPLHPAHGDIVLAARHSHTHTAYKIVIWTAPCAVQVRKAHQTIIPSTPLYDNDTFRLPWCATEAPPRIPDRLLHGPWNDEKLALLELLAAAGAYLDEDDGFARSRRALRQVIRERDYATFDRLLAMYVRPAYYKYPMRWPVQGNHFRAAMKYAEARDDPFLARLVELRWGDLNEDELLLKNEIVDWVGVS
ncbi:hypothetical protein BDV59DRAFT_7046 [Aspergillus ambiguus]|uniref:uncharacterized protein n=1 Tax=Aspergillus ambiguus TaxID=176160 RepID=UPI003CCDF41A